MTNLPLTVGSLREALADLPADLPVILSTDEEGNSFSLLWGIEQSHCRDDDGDPYPLHPDDVEDYGPEDLFDAVVLWP